MVFVANVFLSDEAYARLKAAKKAKESFSEVIMQHVPQQINWDEVLGSCKGMDSKKIYAEIKRDREHKLKTTS